MRLLIAGPDGRIAREVVALLAARRLCFDHCTTGEHALQLAREDGYDALLFDASLPDMTAQEFVRRLRAGRSIVPAIGLGGVLLARDRARLLDAGADDIVVVPCDSEELAARIRAVARRRRGFVDSVLRCGPVELHMDSRQARAGGREMRLSPTEYRVLQLLLLRKGALVTKAALLDAVYNDLDEPEIKSIDVLMHRLRKRLAAGGAEGLVSTVWGAGYIIREPVSSDEPAAAANKEPAEPAMVAALH